MKNTTTTSNKSNKKTIIAWSAGLAACAVLTLGIYSSTQSTTPGLPNVADNQPGTVTNQPPVTKQPPTTGKQMANIDGVITEVSKDGNSFKVGDLWVTVTKDTEYGITGPTAPKPSDQLVSKEFKVGNVVSGYTSQDVSTGKVTAERIYNNFPVAPTSQAPVKGKALANIDGVISEVSKDGNSFKVGDLWVTVTQDTEFGITGPTAPKPSDQLVSKEFKVGNFVSGYTSQDVSSGKVTAERIYNNFGAQK
ncbi:DUF5666 domain-containing protein [Paenibacillus pinihumi]|uniref:DUF5666 domain-containing protein n=1 Tax=Paenibacillus pinihumi TaxID=669462 RepID=UPI0004221064|nr:DUF5666 domain-containing protein [Paenibacillus pinihumi]